jgi:hypothetical protein
VAHQEPEPIKRLRIRLGRFIRIYPALEAAFSNDNAARVFEMFLYYESDRLTRGANWFILTDDQGAEASGLSLRQFRDGRDILCDPFNHLFQRERSTFGVSHYRANLDRIHGWLTANGFSGTAPPAGSTDRTQTPSVHKTYTDRYTKRAPSGEQNVHPNKKKEYVRTEINSTDNRTRAGAREAGAGGDQPAFDFVLSEQERSVIELFGEIAGVRLNAKTLSIAQRYVSSNVSMEKLREIVQAEWDSIGDRANNPAGVMVRRLEAIDPAKWKPVKRKQKTGGTFRRPQAKYTDADREQDRKEAHDRREAKPVAERITELQQRIAGAQDKLSRPGANQDYWQAYIDQKQKELEALQVPLTKE